MWSLRDARGTFLHGGIATGDGGLGFKTLMFEGAEFKA